MNNFKDCFEYSMGSRELFDVSLLKNIIPNNDRVIKTDENTDRQGVDYIAEQKDGSTITIDAKTRKPGARKWWRGEPELALEQYSVVEQKKIGWLFKKSIVHPDYILYTFDKSDTDRFYLLPYVLLRKAAFTHWKQWENEYKIKKQPNETHGGYTSSALFVPASIVICAVSQQMTGKAR